MTICTEQFLLVHCHACCKLFLVYSATVRLVALTAVDFYICLVFYLSVQLFLKWLTASKYRIGQNMDGFDEQSVLMI